MMLGDRIKQVRERKNFSQEELAERIGVSRQALSKWENNLSVPRGMNRELLYEVLEWEPDEEEGREDEREDGVKGKEICLRSWKEQALIWSGWLAAIVCLVTAVASILMAGGKEKDVVVGTSTDLDCRNVCLAGMVIQEGAYRDYTVSLMLIKGRYFKEDETEPGGGVYEENYAGECVLFLKEPNGTVTDELWLNLEWEQDEIVFPGVFTLCADDYNRDGAADFTIGIYDSSYMNRYWLYSIDEERKITNIGPEEGFSCLSKDASVMLRPKEGSVDIEAPVFYCLFAYATYTFL